MKKKLNYDQLLLILSLFNFYVSLCSCSKNNSSTTQDLTSISSLLADTVITDTSIFIDITLDGKRILGIQNGRSNQWSWGLEWGGPLSDTSIFEFDRMGATFESANETGLPIFAFSKGNIDYTSLFPRDTLTPSYTLLLPVHIIDSFFLPGNYSYSVLTNDTTFDYLGDTITRFAFPITKILLSSGINILWVDSTGKIWETCNGTKDQTGSYFTIIKNETWPALSTLTGYTNGTTVSANFDCKLYDGLGNMIHLTNGRFRLSNWF